VTARFERGEPESSTTVTLRNTGRTLAFGVRLKVDRASSGRVGRHARRDDEVLPVLWEDNYLAVLPGETRQVRATYATKDLRGSAPAVGVEGWNVKPTRVEP
jgi:exo-1,4-beta-D-glucosaminidase